MEGIDTEKFHAALLARRAELAGDVTGLHAEAASPAGEVRMPTHMADLASDASAVEENLGQIVTIGDELRQIDEALERLVSNASIFETHCT